MHRRLRRPALQIRSAGLWVWVSRREFCVVVRFQNTWKGKGGPVADAMGSVRLAWPHVFANSRLNYGKPLTTITEQSHSDDDVRATFKSEIANVS